MRDGRSEQGPGGDSSASSKHRANSRTLRLLAWGYRAWSLVIVNFTGNNKTVHSNYWT